MWQIEIEMPKQPSDTATTGHFGNRPMKDPVVLVDAHVHVHPVADVSRLLSAAAENFTSVASQVGAREWQGVLLLAEMAGNDWFEALLSSPGNTAVGGWQVSAGAEAVSVHLSNDDGTHLFVVAGRQLVTNESIEVLALGTRQQILDRQSLQATLAAVRDTGAISVLPWGAGKWFGKRGQLVTDVLAKAAERDVYAGDNSGRPVLWPSPDVFKLAESQGFAVLPGTDPLPLSGEEQRVGSFGFWMVGQLPMDAPMATLKALLARRLPDTVHRYGIQEPLWRFARNQAALRLSKSKV